MENLTESRVKELLEKEEILNALEGGGVDNWDGYDFALESFRKRKEVEELRFAQCSSLLEEIEEALCEGIEEPAGTGCGFGFLDSARQDALEILLKAPITFTNE